MKQRNRKIYFGFIAVLMLSEMITSNVYSLIGPLEDTAELMGVSVSVESIRLVILIILDVIPGVGAVLVLWAYRSADAVYVGRLGVILTTGGMLAYGIYQFWSATFQLGNMQNFVRLVGVVYASLGIIAWLVGRDLRQGLSRSDRQA
ncbi:MAG: hypothetical protein QGH93_12695 [Gammaproteobacteria bacterium]|jgi:hypothetical protein|nr:hypothetical protein [Chromatiales bacterium]MDP6675691.1 hypothetical protein [Gammaproteobacteria bacterium]